MMKKTSVDAAKIAAYRLAAAGRRARSDLQSDPSTPVSGVTVIDGVVSIELPINAKSISDLGGATKVLGRSKFSLPEFKTSRDEK